MSDDFDAFFTTVLEDQTGREQYPDGDRYRDFKQVFGSEQGQRVLLEILSWGHVTRLPLPMAGPIDPIRFAINEGQRRVVLRILHTMNFEPKQNKAVKTNSREITGHA